MLEIRDDQPNATIGSLKKNELQWIRRRHSQGGFLNTFHFSMSYSAFAGTSIIFRSWHSAAMSHGQLQARRRVLVALGTVCQSSRVGFEP